MNNEHKRIYEQISELRRERGVRMEDMCKGIYSLSSMSRIENGERHIKKMERDYLLGRLGVEEQRVTDYVSERFYVRWQARQEMIDCLEAEDWQGLEEKLHTYKEGMLCKLEKQFVGAMEYLLMRQKGTKRELLAEHMKTVVRYTISKRGGMEVNQLLSPVEMNLLMEYHRCKDHKEPEALGKAFEREIEASLWTTAQKDCLRSKLEYLEGKVRDPLSLWVELYRQRDVYCINREIHKERRRRHISREALAEDICSVRTLERIELHGSNVQTYIARRLLQKLEITDELCLIRE